MYTLVSTVWLIIKQNIFRVNNTVYLLCVRSLQMNSLPFCDHDQKHFDGGSHAMLSASFLTVVADGGGYSITFHLSVSVCLSLSLSPSLRNMSEFDV